jgi:homocysteine S-methyltransferase
VERRYRQNRHVTTSGRARDPSPSCLSQAFRASPLVLDGGLAGELERSGHDLSGPLWSARLLQDDPEALVQVHAQFVRAGAQVLTTASYQASYQGFAQAEIEPEETTRLLRRSVALARRAAGDLVGSDGPDRVWIAASVGPYGAMLADGSEYTGAYAVPQGPVDVAALRAFHARRLEVLAQAGADVLACETIPCAAEAESLLCELDGLGVPAWLSLTTVTGGDGVVRTRTGERAQEVFALARDVPEVIAVGINCTDPAGVSAAVRVAARASGKPVVVYPNSGESWDSRARAWRGEPEFDRQDLAEWLQDGARLIGGCCRVTPEQIAWIRRVLPAGNEPA